jgi:hypothetical protein
MKNLKSLFSIILIAFALITVTSCGDESEDPKPVVSTPVWVGYWGFQSAVVTPKNGSVYTVTSLCTSKLSPQFNGEYNLTSETAAIRKSPCSGDADMTYVGTIVNGKLTSVEFKDQGSKSLILTNVIVDEVNKTITGNQTFPMGDASNIVITFKLK